MSSAAPDAAQRRLLVGGSGPMRYAVALEDIAGVEEEGDLSTPRREVNLPTLFDLPSCAPQEDRYARVAHLPAAAYLRLGPDVRAEEIPAACVEPVPPILAVAAARWGWQGLGVHESFAFVVVDAQVLGRLGALRRGEDGR